MEEKQEKEQEKEQTPEGYYLTEIPASFVKVIALGDKQVPVEELIIKIANALKKSGILKD